MNIYQAVEKLDEKQIDEISNIIEKKDKELLSKASDEVDQVK